jgi:hypothetical protein
MLAMRLFAYIGIFFIALPHAELIGACDPARA